MAFDYDDTDALYDTAILPVLKANNIVPVIINRREDNRDINQQIIEQLNVCDFCIADLTYTRPSVYFEAGFAQRAVEVIYTVRADHLRKDQPDNLRVHFDLQMKPLIKWTSPSDRTFPERLQRRIRGTVLRRWNKTQKEKIKRQQQQSNFAHIPLDTRIAKLRSGVISTILKLGFSNWISLVGPYALPEGIPSPQKLSQLIEPYWILGKRQENETLRVVSVRIEESLTLKKLRSEFGNRLVGSSLTPHLNGHRMVQEQSTVDQTIEHHILGSIRLVPQSRIMSAMPSLSWDPTKACYRTVIDWQFKSRRQESEKWVEVVLLVTRIVYVHFIDNIKSLPEFQERLNAVIEQIKEKKIKDTPDK